MTQTIGSMPRRIWAFMLAMLLLFGVLLSGFVTPVWAPIIPVQRAYIQTTVDTSAWEIAASSVSHGVGVGGNPMESKRMGKDTMSMLAGTTTPSDQKIIDFLKEGSFEKVGGDTVDNLPLSFPGSISFSGFNNSSNQSDIDRAQLVRSSLIYDLNSAFRFVYADKYGEYEPTGSTLDEQISNYAKDLSNFFSGLGQGSWPDKSCVVVKTQEPQNPVDINFHADAGTDYYVTIQKTVDGRTEEQTFQYRMLKGYGKDGSGLGKINGDSTEYIHWGTFAVEAFVNFYADDDLKVTTDNVMEGTPGIAEKTIAGIFGSITDFIANSLGLWNFDELIFNGGTRGSTSYVAGVFPASWQSVIWTFFFVAEIAAVIMLLYAIIFNVGKKAMSTMDPVARASAIEQIKYLFIVAFLLAIVPYVIPILFDACAQLTGIFHDVLGGKTAQERFKKLAANSGAAGLGSLLTYAIYLGALIYFNVFYVFRALSLALMIILMPIFIAMMALSENKRRQTMDFFREFCANLFIQPLQALMLSFILLVPDTGRSIDSIVMAYVMIPLTNLMRQLFFGGAGGMADQVGQQGKRAGSRLAMLGGALAVGAGAGAIKGLASGIKGSGKSGSDSKAEGTEAGASEAKSTNFASQMANKIKNSAPVKAVAVGAGKAADKVKAGASQLADKIGQNPVVQGAKTMANKFANTTAGKVLGGGAKVVGAGAQAFGGVAAAAGVGMAGIGLGALGGAVGVVDKRLFGGALSKPLEQLSMKTVGAAKGIAGVGVGAAASTLGIKQQSGMKDESSANSIYGETLKNPGVATEGDNAYAKGFATRARDAKSDTSTYTVDRDNFKAAGVKAGKTGINSAGQKQFDASYSMSQLSKGDQTRLAEMRNIWENGSDEERAAMRAMGISGFEATTAMVNGKEEMTGANITYDSDKARDNLGISNKGGYSVTAKGDQAPSMVPDIPSMLNTPKAAAALGASKLEAMKLQTSIDPNTGDVTLTAPAAKFQATPMPESMAAQVASAKVGRDGNMSITVPQAEMASTFGPVAASSNTMGPRAMAAGISPETSMGQPTTQTAPMPTMVAPAIHMAQSSLGNQGLTVTPSADGQTYTISGANAEVFQNAQVPAAMARPFSMPQIAQDGSASVTVPASDLTGAYTVAGRGAAPTSIPVATPAAHNCAEAINAQQGVQAVAQGSGVVVQSNDFDSFQSMSAAAPIVQDVANSVRESARGVYTAQITPQTVAQAQAVYGPMPQPQQVREVLNPITVPVGDPIKATQVQLGSTMPVQAPAQQPAQQFQSSLGQGGEQFLNVTGSSQQSHQYQEPITRTSDDGNSSRREPVYDGPPRGKSDLENRTFN